MHGQRLWTVLSTLLFVTSIALLGCAEDDDPDVVCDKDECVAPACELVCAQLYRGCDFEFQVTKRRAASGGECVMACDKGFFTNAELGCLADSSCARVAACFDNDVPALPAELLVPELERPEGALPEEFAPPWVDGNGPHGLFTPPAFDGEGEFYPATGEKPGREFLRPENQPRDDKAPSEFYPPEPGDDEPGLFTPPAFDGPGEFYPTDLDGDQGYFTPPPYDGEGEFYPATSEEPGREFLRPENQPRDDQAPSEFYPPEPGDDDPGYGPVSPPRFDGGEREVYPNDLDDYYDLVSPPRFDGPGEFFPYDPADDDQVEPPAFEGDDELY